jgi:hypothetical protein
MVTDIPTAPDADATAIALATEKRGPGRPRVVLDLEAVRKLATIGLNATQIADRLRIGRRTLLAKAAEDPAVRQALDEGLSDGISFAAGKLWEKIEAGDLGSIVFYLRTRAHWRSAPDTLNVNVRQFGGPAPTIDDHVLDLAARHTALLDSPDPDGVVDVEWSEVTAVSQPPEPAAPDTGPTDTELADLMM